MPTYTLKLVKIEQKDSIGRQLKATIAAGTNSVAFGFKGPTGRNKVIAKDVYFSGIVDVLIRIDVIEVDAKESDKPFSGKTTVKIDPEAATTPNGFVVVRVSEVGGKGGARGKKATLSFFFEAEVDTAFSIRDIPGIMTANKWPTGAAMMNRWFAAPAGRQSAETQTVKMDWVLGYARAKVAHDEILDRKLYLTENAKALIKKKYGPVIGNFGDFTLPIPELHKDQIQYQFVEIKAKDGIDDLFVALGDFHFYVAVKGVATAKEITITHIGIYVRDDYEFDGPQPLGFWDRATNYGGFNPRKGTPVGNGSFRSFRKKTNTGGDFLIFSADLKEIELPKPVVIKK